MADGHLIKIEDNVIIAFDILLKLHYCFYVEFASDVINFYDFITSCIMKYQKPKGCSITLDTTLQNVSLKENDEKYVITGLYFSIFPCSHTKNFIIILTVTIRFRLKNVKFKKLIIRTDSAAVALRNS